MEISGLKYGNVPSLDVMEMEALLKQCPWFSYLREIMMEKLYRIDEEAFREKLAASAVFLSSRKTLYDRINAPVEDLPLDEEVEEVVQEPAVFEQPSKPRVVVVGGDFFSKDDLKSISPEEDMELKLRNSPFYRPVEEAPKKEEEPVQPAAPKRSSLLTEDGKVNFDDLAFCTETLGHIYAQQGFYDKAIDVFSKLILLYPQKSAYFAALVNDMKTRSAKPSE
ncbi:MAG: tetratricopeptide repeat protein [Bacteroidales bacterium]|nr:tetratricopeptide repeat protein [Bacteroidales bacterium]MBP5518437.1 tetratricopeptide repeat protein [Bacteroidales bacterium]